MRANRVHYITVTNRRPWTASWPATLPVRFRAYTPATLDRLDLANGRKTASIAG
jgi:hypothetical protein